MLKRILYYLIVIVIVVGAVISYKQLDFGNKTAICSGFSWRPDPDDAAAKVPALSGRSGQGEFKPPAGFEGRPRGEFGQGEAILALQGARFSGAAHDGKGMRGKPGMGKTISLVKVIPISLYLPFSYWRPV
jgi:hypothetical protein